MRQEWGREEYAGEWPSEQPVWTIAALLFALLSAGAIAYYCYAREWTPLQRHYLGAYLGTQAAGALRTDGWYTLLVVETGQVPRLALDSEVEAVVTESGQSTFALTSDAAHAGAKLEWQKGKYNNAKLHAFLGYWIYEDQTLTGLLKPALWGSLAVLALGLVVAIPKDAVRARERKHGRRLKGPEMVEAGEFQRRTGADGVGFLREKSRGKRRGLRVPREIESSHFLIMGDSGTGKSALIRQLLLQVEERGEAAIVYDPALEYTPEFLNPSRGDVVLNPLDERMPYWSPGDEIRHEAEALTLAASLFPDRHNENPFFVEGPRKIFAHLLTLRPGPDCPSQRNGKNFDFGLHLDSSDGARREETWGKSLKSNGGQGRNRTADAILFSAVIPRI